MKVLYTTNIPSPYRMNFFNELGLYCRLTVLFETNRADDRDENWMIEKESTFHAVYMKQVYRKKDTAFCPEVISHFRKSKADIIVVGGYSTPTGMFLIQYLKRHKIPFILNCDGGLVKADSWIKNQIKRFFISSATVWLSTGKSCTQYLIHYGARKSGVFVYPFTSVRAKDVLEYPLSNIRKQSVRKKLSIGEQRVIVSVGQFIYRKGYDILIEAMKGDSETGIYIIGGEPLPEYLALRDKYNLDNLHFVGFKSKEELEEFYIAADLFVLPTREDIWGLVVNEAMAYGLPVVTTTRCVAGQELIEEGVNGYLVEVDNCLQLREKIDKILQNKRLIEEMRENNLRKICGYTIENMAKCHIEIFNRVIEEKL